MPDKKILIAYYSRTGNTRKVAEKVSAKLNAEIIELIDQKNSKGFFGWFGVIADAMKSRKAQLKDISVNLSDYDIVILGTPIWGGVITPVAKTFLEKYQNEIGNLALIITSGGNDPDNPLDKKIAGDIEKSYGKKVEHCLHISKMGKKSPQEDEKKIETFVNAFS